MVSLSAVQASNSRLASAPRLVAVFVGATSGIGEAALKAFAKHANQPCVYFVGRSQEAGDRITAECKALNQEGNFTFIQANTSLIVTVDEVCQTIKSKEKAVNILNLSTGTLVFDTETAEGLHYAASLVTYARNRFIVNLLPLLQQADYLRRVVTVLCAGKEGTIDTNNFQGRKIPKVAQLGHAASMVTLPLEALAQKAPNVTFIHNHPGVVKTNLIRKGDPLAMRAMSLVFKVLAPMICVPIKECGERHLYLATSARYPSGDSLYAANGVSLADGDVIATGTDGRCGSGVYSIDPTGESSGVKVQQLLAQLRQEGMVQQVWSEMDMQYQRITGQIAA